MLESEGVPSKTHVWIDTLAAIGLLIGVGLYTFVYAQDVTPLKRFVDTVTPLSSKAFTKRPPTKRARVNPIQARSA